MIEIFAKIARLFALVKAWVWWPFATRRPAHPGRVGGKIDAWAIVLHTTDMLPDTFGSLVNSWTTQRSKGQCAHFLIGLTPAQGVIQFVPLDRNSNHAGGFVEVEGKLVESHGWFRRNGKRIHPNTVTVAIEVHNAGQLRLVNGQWRSWDYTNKRPQGPAFDVADVDVDLHRKDRAWHRMTQWQHEQLKALLHALEARLAPMPSGITIETNGPQTNPWATVADLRILGHVTLDPARKTDPGPEVMREYAR